MSVILGLSCPVLTLTAYVVLFVVGFSQRFPE